MARTGGAKAVEGPRDDGPGRRSAAGRPPLREAGLREADRRRQIIEAAQTLFFEKSYEQVSIRDLERESGLSRGPLYYYFRNKEEIYSAVVTEGLVHVRDVFRAAVDAEPLDDPEAQLRAVVRAFLGEFDTARPLFDILMRFFFGMRHGAPPPPELLQRANALVRACIDLVVDVISRGVEHGRFACADPEFEAMALWGLVVTAVQMSDDNPRFASIGRPRPRLLADIEAHVLAQVGVQPGVDG